jgi:hypothetical protein
MRSGSSVYPVIIDPGKAKAAMKKLHFPDWEEVLEQECENTKLKRPSLSPHFHAYR